VCLERRLRCGDRALQDFASPTPISTVTTRLAAASLNTSGSTAITAAKASAAIAAAAFTAAGGTSVATTIAVASTAGSIRR
jgi:hypothetical protein